MRESHWSYSHGTSEVQLLGSTIGDLLDRITEQYPENEAVVSKHQNIRLTYRELRDAFDRFARGLMSCGIAKGDRVGIWSTNNVEWIITQFATAKIGAILVNINPAYRVSELEYALRQSGCSTLIIASPFKTSNYGEMLQEVCPELVRCETGRLQSGRLPELRTVIGLGEHPPAWSFSWKNVLDKAETVSSDELKKRQAQLDFDDPINIQYTSGTTGFPKGATLCHHSILNNGFFIGERMRFTDQDRLCIPVPFYHCFGMVLGNLACVTHGATMVLPSETFDPVQTLKAVSEERCTALHGVPTMFVAELAVPEFDSYDLSSLRTGIMAGAPCPIEIMKQVKTRMHMSEITIAYGMTETSPVSCQTEPGDPIEKQVSTVGRAHPHVECKIVDPSTGATVPRRVTGEFLSRGYILMLGYWNNPEATASSIDSARWMHTGDLAVMDEEGYIRIVGRSKDLIIRGGENIYPREVEEFLYSHPKIKDVQVIGVPDDVYGEEVMAWVVLKEFVEATPQELRAFCSGKITHFKIPRYWRFTDSFPMTVTGKIQKYKMREISCEEIRSKLIEKTK
ncbi:AMP-binding protein [bacterium]|nr:AMP-binding protein [bacterium]